MNSPLPTIRYAGYHGEICNIRTEIGKVLFVPDSNLVLTLRKNLEPGVNLPQSYQLFLRETKRRVHQQWNSRVKNKFLCVDPSLASLELSRQDSNPNKANFFEYYFQFFQRVYGIENICEDYANIIYWQNLRIMESYLPGAIKLISEVLRLCEVGGTSNEDILERVDSLFDWIQSNESSISAISGALLYVSIYAFANSEEACRILKTKRVAKDGITSTATNVAWDFLYLVMHNSTYTYQIIEKCILCSSDKALMDLLFRIVRKGNRYRDADFSDYSEVQEECEFVPFKLSKLNSGTKLEKQINEKYKSFSTKLKRKTNLWGETFQQCCGSLSSL